MKETKIEMGIIDDVDTDPDSSEGLAIDLEDQEYFSRQAIQLDIGATVLGLVAIGATVGELVHLRRHKRALAS